MSDNKFLWVLQSRKFWAAVVGLVFIVVNAALNQQQIDPNTVTNAVMAIVAAYIGATAYEDSQQAKANATVEAAQVSAATTTTVTTPSENVTISTEGAPQ